MLKSGGTETQAIAALLHDSTEDCGGRPMLDTVRVMFGNDVAEIVEGCTEVRAEGRDGVVKVVTSDVVNDLAQLQIPGTVSAQAIIADEPAKLRQGEGNVVFGFPLNALPSSGGNLTPGVVSALTGLGNNTNQIPMALINGGTRTFVADGAWESVTTW